MCCNSLNVTRLELCDKVCSLFIISLLNFPYNTMIYQFKVIDYIYTKLFVTLYRHSQIVIFVTRSEEHTSELQSRFDLVCRLLLEKKNAYYHTLYLTHR